MNFWIKLLEFCRVRPKTTVLVSNSGPRSKIYEIPDPPRPKPRPAYTGPERRRGNREDTVIFDHFRKWDAERRARLANIDVSETPYPAPQFERRPVHLYSNWGKPVEDAEPSTIDERA